MYIYIHTHHTYTHRCDKRCNEEKKSRFWRRGRINIANHVDRSKEYGKIN